MLRLAYDTALAAAQAARAVRAALGPASRIGGHYGLGADGSAEVLAAAPPGACLFSPPLAAAVAAADGERTLARVEGLYALLS